MATYKEIHGVKVQYRDSDATAIEGDVWYNASTGNLKMYALLGSWATGNNINTARRTMPGAGTNTLALAVGGYTTAAVASTEEWTVGQNVEIITD